MRTKPIIGSRAWFKPRRLGWGWTPATWQGWLVTLAAVVALVVVGFTTSDGVRLVATGIVLAVLIGVAYLTGTSPGGP